MTDAWHRFINNVELRRFVVLIMIIFALWLMRSLMNMILFTFILTFISVTWIRFVKRWLPKISIKFLVVLTYVLILLLLYFGITKYLPVLVRQVVKMANSVIKFYSSQDATTIFRYVNHYISRATILSQAKHGLSLLVSTLTSIGTVTVTFFLSLILSFFFSLDLQETSAFSKMFLNSTFGWLFQDIAYFGKKFVNTFGVVLEAQFFIAICNTILTTIGLLIMKMPQIFALGLVVFVFSLVPVAGVIISTIPLGLVAYTVGGVRDVIYVIIMIAVIHVLEAYVLNPKFMASQTDLPIFYTFIILLVSEHFWGTWGLIVGVPIFTFLLDIMGVKPIHSRRRVQTR